MAAGRPSGPPRLTMTRIPPIRRAIAALVILGVAATAGLMLRAALNDDPTNNGTSLPAVSGGSTKFSLHAAEAQLADESIIATARHTSIAAYRRPGLGARRRITARIVSGHTLPLVFLVVRRRPGWLRVALPVRPNRSTAWIRRKDVTLAADPYAVRVQLRRHRILVTRGHQTILRGSIAVGKALSPTPTGRYYITDLLRPPDPHGFYGPFAFGLSAHSPIYTTFEGGDGQVGIHGTNQPAAIGRDVSHGCIRIHNALITRLARLLPLGTPVVIERT